MSDPLTPKPENSALRTPNSELTIRIPLRPTLITLLAAPATVLLTMLLAWLLLTTLSLPLHPSEMLAAALINTLAGLAATLLLALRMKRGAAALAVAGLASIGVRMGIVLVGLLMACAPAWHLNRTPLILWAVAFYFPLLITETTLVAWLIKKAKT